MNNEKLTITRKKPKGEDGYKVFSVRLKDDLVVQLDDLAAETGRSRNDLIARLLTFALKNCEVEND